MQVVLSLLTLVPGGMGGSETYVRELARELAARDRVETSVLVPGNVEGGYRGEIPIPQVRIGPSIAARLWAILQALRSGRRIRASMVGEVVHYPFTIPVPSPNRAQATVITVHDVQHRDLPELFSVPERMFRYFLYDRPARKAELVVTVSAFAKQGIVRHLGIPADRVRVIPLAVNIDEFTPNLGVRGDFVLYPARGWKHKNHLALVEAMRILRSTRPGMRLVLTGGALESLGDLPDWVEVRGNVPRAELRELYRSASVLAFPSLYEGFGLPPLEAMASGCPVAASDEGSLPEVCGDAAVYFDPKDPADIAHGILEAIARSGELAEAGLARVREFSWSRCAGDHEAAYREAASRHAASSGAVR